MSRVLLVLPTATYRSAAFLSAAQRLGVEVVTASERPQALAEIMGDHFVEVDLDDPQRGAASIVELAGRLPLDAVIAVDDQGALVAAHAAQQLGLAHNPPQAIAITRDKAAMRARLGAADVSQPRWLVVAGRPGDGDAEADDVVAAAERLGFPVVIKPVSLAASRGVIRADNATGARVIARRVRAIATDAGAPASEPLLVEGFVAGEELALEGLVTNGHLEVLARFDKPDPLDGPYFEETIYTTPSRQSPSLLATVDAVAGAAIDAIGLVDGPIHAELRLPVGGEPVLLEVAARTIGGRCAATLNFAGASLEELVLAHAIGASSHRPGASGSSGVMMIPIPRSGRLRAVEGIETARAVDGVTGVEFSIPVGRPVTALPEGDRYLGFIFARAATPAAVEVALRHAHAALTISIVAEAP